MIFFGIECIVARLGKDTCMDLTFRDVHKIITVAINSLKVCRNDQNEM